MFKKSNSRIDLSERQKIWLRPGETLYAFFDLERDATGAGIEIFFSEIDWQFSSRTYVKAEDQAFELSSDEDGVVDITINIPEEWNGRVMRYRILLTEDEITYCVVDGTVCVMEGE